MEDYREFLDTLCLKFTRDKIRLNFELSELEVEINYIEQALSRVEQAMTRCYEKENLPVGQLLYDLRDEIQKKSGIIFDDESEDITDSSEEEGEYYEQSSSSVRRL
ncbi:MAG: hypothetical protein N2B06_17240 [Clostridium sp.]